jgi:hypothetical protein
MSGMTTELLNLTPLDAKKAQQELALETEGWMTELAQIVGNEQKKNNPTFTGMKLAKGNPEKYGRIVMERTKLGMTVREIAALERCSPQTVKAIMQIEEAGKTADQYKSETGVDLAVAVKLTLGRITECLMDDGRMKEAGPRDLAYLLKELTEKKELLSGGATHRGEVVDKGEEERAAAMKHAQQARELLEGELVEAEMVSGGEAVGCRL